MRAYEVRFGKQVPERHRQKVLYLTDEAMTALSAWELQEADRADEMSAGMAGFIAEINTAVMTYDIHWRRRVAP